MFQYKARNEHGDAIEGMMDAASSDLVASHLFENGLVPINISVVTPKVDAAIEFEKYFPAKAKISDVIQFSRQMHSLLKAGVPILTSLTGLAGSTKNLMLKSAIKGVTASLESGRDLATSLSEHPKIFSLFYVSMIRIGETSGTLDAIFLQLAKYLERDKKTAQQIKSATRYPMFVLSAIGVALVVINIFVIPTFANMFAKYDADLPWATQVLLGTSNFTVNYWPVLLVFAILAIFGVSYYVSTPDGRYFWDKKKLRLPIVGPLIHRAVLARFARLFSMSAGAGVPIITSLTVVAKALDNSFVENRVLGMQTGIERGESISSTASTSGMFDSLVLQMMSVGEETGSLDELLKEVADYYDTEVEYEIERLSASIEPILTITIGLIVLVLALGVFLPMWGIAGVAMHK